MDDLAPEVTLAIAREALDAHGLADAHLRLLTVSENATYLVEHATRGDAVLRVHRTGYHDVAAIEAELAWIDALRDAGAVRTARVLAAASGQRVVTVPAPEQDRHAVLFERVAGREPDPDADGVEGFARLGAVTAALHAHARAWTHAAASARFRWDLEATLGAAPRWGRWSDGIGVGAAERAVLGPAAELVGERLSSYGAGADHFGLVHADLRLANLLVDPSGATTVIDFDDCGFSWFGYDFGSAVSFLEHDERLPAWQGAWLRGYREVAPLDDATESMLPTFVMLRRLMLLAWMGSHSHAPEVARLGPDYTAGSVALARTYLETRGEACSPPSMALR